MGLALGQVLNLSGTMQWAVRQSAEAENNMTSIERLLEYTRLPQARAPYLSLRHRLAAIYNSHASSCLLGSWAIRTPASNWRTQLGLGS